MDKMERLTSKSFSPGYLNRGVSQAISNGFAHATALPTVSGFHETVYFRPTPTPQPTGNNRLK